MRIDEQRGFFFKFSLFSLSFCSIISIFVSVPSSFPQLAGQCVYGVHACRQVVFFTYSVSLSSFLFLLIFIIFFSIPLIPLHIHSFRGGDNIPAPASVCAVSISVHACPFPHLLSFFSPVLFLCILNPRFIVFHFIVNFFA